LSIIQDSASISIAGQKATAVPENPPARTFRILSAALGQGFSSIRASQFNRNMGAGSIMALIGTCLSFISYPIYLHYLGYHRYGLWLVLSVVVSVAQLGNLGIPWALMKLVAEDRGGGRFEGS
jgi:hypothetical protein